MYSPTAWRRGSYSNIRCAPNRAMRTEGILTHGGPTWLRERICVVQEKAALLLSGLDDDELLQMNTLLGICAGRIEDAAEARAAFRRANAVNLHQKTCSPGGGMAVR